MIIKASLLLGAALATAYLLLMAYAYFRADSLIFPAPEASYIDDSSIKKLKTATGDTISILYLPVEKSAQLLLYSHGNGEDLGYIRPLLESFQEAGIAVLSYDYPGYGTSPGIASEAATYAAADAVYQYALLKLNYKAADIVLYGRSLGSGPSTWLAERYAVGGLIMDGAFSSTFRVLTGIKLLPWDKFDNLARLPRIRCPIFLIHGKLDQIVPFSHAKANARAVGPRATSLWVDQANHNDLIDQAPELYWQSTLNFIRNPQDNGH